MKDAIAAEWMELAFTLFAIPVLGLLSRSFITYIKRKIADVEQRIGNDAVNQFLALAENAIESAVTAVNQTFVENMKKQGTFDASAMAESFRMAKDKALAIIGEQAKDGLKLALGDIEAWLEARIEYYVNRSKKL
ncbi:hypothetical protein [Paenibacillus macerans]|uniref:hypothetical protein n=1 Tax=Paenibacillus macerans TaxID=44252 RepID=UPI00203F6141|nr:hypothetical protein [Paenibacillus macerans]MCM3702391.1 hypothetical protein [Paenibacillus macerans]